MNFKKIISLVLVLAMCLSMIPSYAFAGDECFDHLYEAIEVVEPGCETEGYTLYQCPTAETGTKITPQPSATTIRPT